MRPTPPALKENAFKLRSRGLSIREIEKRLNIARSTLSGWLRKVALTAAQRKKLRADWEHALVKARQKAVIWHNVQKQKRLETAKMDALKTLRNINSTNKNILELALAVLYSGEGSKKNIETALGSSDPLPLKFFLAILRNIYGINAAKIRCELYLRADQNPEKIKRFWARELKLPLKNFKQVSIDKRTRGSRTYPSYKGVCNLRCGNVAIQRKLIYLSEAFFRRTAEQFMRA